MGPRCLLSVIRSILWVPRPVRLGMNWHMHKLRRNIRRLRHSNTIVLVYLPLHLRMLGHREFIKCNTTRSHLPPPVSRGGVVMAILGSTLIRTVLSVSGAEKFFSTASSRSHKIWSIVIFIGILYFRGLRRDFKLSLLHFFGSLRTFYFILFFGPFWSSPAFSSHHTIRSHQRLHSSLFLASFGLVYAPNAAYDLLAFHPFLLCDIIASSILFFAYSRHFPDNTRHLIHIYHTPSLFWTAHLQFTPSRMLRYIFFILVESNY